MVKDIVKAIEKEKEYLAYREKGEQPYALVDAVNEYGFDELSDYFSAKREYLLGQLTFKEWGAAPEDTVATFFEMMESGEPGFGISFIEKTFVWGGGSKPINKDAAEEFDVPIYSLETVGGSTVASPGDMSFGICVPTSLNVDMNFFLVKLKKIMSKYISNVEVINNDILIDGKKVCGATRYYHGNVFCFIAHFSFNSNPELIDAICMTDKSLSVKTPGYIKGMSREDLSKEIRLWLKVQ